MMKPVVEGRVLQAVAPTHDRERARNRHRFGLPDRVPGAPGGVDVRQRRAARRSGRCGARASARGGRRATRRSKSPRPSTDSSPDAAVRRDGCHWRRARVAATLARLDQARAAACSPSSANRRRNARCCTRATPAAMDRRRSVRNRSALSESRGTAAALRALTHARPTDYRSKEIAPCVKVSD